MKPDFYLDINQNCCSKSIDNTPWIFFLALKDQLSASFLKA